jgi:two-component system LytT family response regulator
MIRSILVDDEVNSLDALTILLNEYCPQVEVVARCASPQLALDLIRKLSPELLFLDIEMPGFNGFELLERLGSIPFQVIFTSGYDQYGIKAIKFSALDYVLKPIDPQELVAAVNKVQVQKHLPTPAQYEFLLSQIQNRDLRLNKLAIPTNDGYVLLSVEQIVFCEANDNYTHFRLKGGKNITACRTLKEIEEQLSEFPFLIRVHHSYLVNLNEVLRYVRGEGGYLVMNDGASINVSRSRKESLLRKINFIK